MSSQQAMVADPITAALESATLNSNLSILYNPAKWQCQTL